MGRVYESAHGSQIKIWLSHVNKPERENNCEIVNGYICSAFFLKTCKVTKQDDLKLKYFLNTD